MNAKPNTQKVKTLRILIAEDEATDADLVERELRREGMQIEARRVETQEAFLRELGEFRPDIVLSDYNMPSFDGITALRLTREHAPDTPFIMVTGSISEETAVDCIKAGAADYVLKDRRTRLPEAVKAALHKASLEQEKREAQEAIRLSAREWRTTFDAMADLVCVLGPDRTILRCNQAFRDFVGRDWAEILGKTCCEVLGHGEPGTGICPFLAMQEKRETFKTDVRVGERWFAVSVNPLLAEDGSLLGGIHVMTDITGRRAAEQALRQSEATLAEAQRQAHLGSWTVELAGDKALWSDEHWRIWGYQPGEATADRDFLMRSIHPDDRANFARQLADMIAGGKPLDVEFRIVRPDGSIRVVQSSSEMQRNANGNPVRLVGSALDVTERRAVERALEKQLRFVQSLLDTLPTPVFLKDLEGRYTLCNRAFAEMNRRPASEILGKTAFDPLPQDAAEEQDRLDRDLIEHPRPQHYETTRTVSGFPTLQLVVHKAVVQDLEGRPSGVLSVIVDITDLKNAQVALQESHEKYRSMVDNIGIGVSLVSPDLRVLEMNAQMRTWNPNAQPGGPSPCYALFNNPPREAPCSYCPTIKTLADGQVHEAITDTPAGDQVRNYRVVASPVRDASGGVIAAIEMVEDMTDRLLLEAQFRQAQKMEAVGQLAGGVAHDFNNILTGIMGYTRMQLDAAPGGSELSQDLTEVMELSQRAANLTRQLLAFSRRQTLLPQILDLNRVVEDITKMLGRLIGEDIDLRFVPGSGLDHIKADPGQVEQVLMNLAVNARDAMPQGGQLTIETCNVVLDQHYVEAHLDTLPGAYVQIAVTDTGCGMSKETLQHIFEPFFTTKEVGKGTGLGLATTFGIVKQHNGSIQVYSEVDRGTTFRIYFPATTEATNGALRQARAKASGGNETILVVEDEEAVCEIAKRILTQHGYTVLTAANGDKAEALFGEHRDGIALVLTDVIMPGTSGRELAERLRLLSPSLRVLFMSGYSDNAVFRHGVLGKRMAFIGKPFAQEDLLLAVRKVLDTA